MSGSSSAKNELIDWSYVTRFPSPREQDEQDDDRENVTYRAWQQETYEGVSHYLKPGSNVLRLASNAGNWS